MIRKDRDRVYGKWKHKVFNQLKGYLRGEQENKQDRRRNADKPSAILDP